MAAEALCFQKDSIEVFGIGDELGSENAIIIDFNQKDALNKYLNGSKENEVEDLNEIINKEPAEQLKLRNYQEELAAPALQGVNTIVCAPTGSGKTIVAVKIIADHLSQRKSNASDKTAKVAFLVPTVNLVDQQQDVLQRYLRGRFKIFGLKSGQTGTNKPPKKMVVQRCDIVVMTPQLLLNMLTIKEDALDLTLKITDFSLLVFDECHHADKSHPYNELMNLYFDIKFNKNRTVDEILPQIVGLTASLGVGQAANTSSACDHIIKICANLDVKKLSLIERYKDELENFVYAPKDELVAVRCAHYDHLFSKHIIAMMTSIENLLTSINNHITEMNIKHDGLNFTPPEKRWSAVYTNWVYGWYHFAPTLENAEFKRQLTTCIEHLIVYHNTLEINAHVPTKYAFQYLTDEFEIIIRKKTTPLDDRLIALYNCMYCEIFFKLISGAKLNALALISNDLEEKNPIVKELKRILLEEYKAKEDSRTLIFVRTRELARAVERYLNADSDLQVLKAGYLTGVNAKKEEGGQTEREQQEFLERFKRGEHKVVVATTVAEEGLDIEKCNVVIKYNHVTNEIAMVQRRGRGRAVGSKSILLTHEGWIEQKEMVNLIREKLMYHALKVIRQKGEAQFIKEVEIREKQAYDDREIEKKQRELNRKRLGNKIFDLKCKKCDKLYVDSTKIRCIQKQHYVCVEPKVWNLLCTEPQDSPKLFESLSVAGKLSCIECRLDNGIIIKYRQVYLPALKSESLVVANRETKEKKCPKKWKQIQENYFVVDPPDHTELVLMYHALKAEIREVLDKILEKAEAEEEAAAQAAREAEAQQDELILL